MAWQCADFYPRSPCGERQRYPAILGCVEVISIHALLAESDGPGSARLASCAYFYPRSPCGERLECWMALNHLLRFLSTLSLRRATKPSTFAVTEIIISIHALLAESDLNCSRKGFAMRYFYPRSPCGERLLGTPDTWDEPVFLSTLSLRRATCGRLLHH